MVDLIFYYVGLLEEPGNNLESLGFLLGFYVLDNFDSFHMPFSGGEVKGNGPDDRSIRINYQQSIDKPKLHLVHLTDSDSEEESRLERELKQIYKDYGFSEVGYEC